MAEVRLDILINTFGTQNVQSAATKVGLLSGAILALGADATKMAAEFDTSMRKVGTIFGQAEAQARGFDEQLQQMAVNRGADVNELAEALYQIGSAGVGAEDGVTVLNAALSGAIGGFTDTKTAADGLTSAMNAWRIEASRAEYVMDVFVTTQNRGKTTVGELAAAIGRVAPTASAMGLSLEETMAALATVTASGISTAEAISGLRGVLAAVMKPSSEAADIANQLGIAFDSQALKAQGLQGFLEGVARATNYSTDAMSQLFGRVEATNTALSLVGENAQRASEDLGAMGDAAGASADAAEQMDGAEQEMKKLKASIDELRRSIGEGLVPVLMDMTENIKPAVSGLSDFAKDAPEVVTGIMQIAAAFAGLSFGMKMAGAALTPILALPAAIAASGAATLFGSEALGGYTGRKAAEAHLSEKQKNLRGTAMEALGLGLGGIMGGATMRSSYEHAYKMAGGGSSTPSYLLSDSARDAIALRNMYGNQDNALTRGFGQALGSEWGKPVRQVHEIFLTLPSGVAVDPNSSHFDNAVVRVVNDASRQPAQR